MIKQANKLTTARACLKGVEEDLSDPDRHGELITAIKTLLQLMSEVSPRIEKDIAKKLVLTCRNKVLSEAKLVLSNFESYEPDYLEHWNRVMEVFVDSRLGDDPEFNTCKEQLLARCANQSSDNAEPVHVDIPNRKELPSAPQDDFYFRKVRTDRTVLHAESLMAIGQSLQMLRLRAFSLEKIGDIHVVRSEWLTEAHEWILRNNLVGEIFESPVPPLEGAEIVVGDGWLCYTPLAIARLNARDLKKRDNQAFEQSSQTDKLPHLLGILGEHLDSKKVAAFKISWSPDSASVEYQTPNGVRECKNFTVEKLQQFALYSRLQRSSRNESIGSR